VGRGLDTPSLGQYIRKFYKKKWEGQELGGVNHVTAYIAIHEVF